MEKWNNGFSNTGLGGSFRNFWIFLRLRNICLCLCGMCEGVVGFGDEEFVVGPYLFYDSKEIRKEHPGKYFIWRGVRLRAAACNAVKMLWECRFYAEHQFIWLVSSLMLSSTFLFDILTSHQWQWYTAYVENRNEWNFKSPTSFVAHCVCRMNPENPTAAG